MDRLWIGAIGMYLAMSLIMTVFLFIKDKRRGVDSYTELIFAGVLAWILALILNGTRVLKLRYREWYYKALVLNNEDKISWCESHDMEDYLLSGWVEKKEKLFQQLSEEDFDKLLASSWQKTSRDAKRKSGLIFATFHE